ncbi:MAG: tetratricopeptide repeat protein [Planctomycetales bacterium]|nr:tetratricopeptide repeat protein [Planctomycetales bacterium]
MSTLLVIRCWPGLPAAWLGSDFKGLCIAILFGWTVSLNLLLSFVWRDWASNLFVAGLWFLICGAMVVEAVRSNWVVPALLRLRAPDLSQDFSLAQTEYLRGDWISAEAILLHLLKEYPRDIEAQLLLAGVLRRTGRRSAALRRLADMQLQDAAGIWQHEILREIELVQLAAAAAQDSTELPAQNA